MKQNKNILESIRSLFKRNSSLSKVSPFKSKAQLAREAVEASENASERGSKKVIDKLEEDCLKEVYRFARKGYSQVKLALDNEPVIQEVALRFYNQGFLVHVGYEEGSYVGEKYNTGKTYLAICWAPDDSADILPTPSETLLKARKLVLEYKAAEFIKNTLIEIRKASSEGKSSLIRSFLLPPCDDSSLAFDLSTRAYGEFLREGFSVKRERVSSETFEYLFKISW